MSGNNSQYDLGLDKNPANYVPLTPLSFIARSAAVYPDHVSTVYEGRVFTWSETYARCRRLASYLASKGVGEGDTVAAMLPNIPAMNEAHFGVPMTGAVLNALNIRLDPPSIAFQLDHGGARIILVDPEFAGVITEALKLMTGTRPFVIDVDDASFGPPKRIGDIEYEAALAQGDPAFVPKLPGDEWNAIALGYTSGTTGNPKGVVTHHRGAYLNAVSNILAGNLGQHPVYLWTLPMFHCNGWCFPWTMAAAAGINVCLRKVEPTKIFELIRKHGVTHMCGAPIVYNTLINAPDAPKGGAARPRGRTDRGRRTAGCRAGRRRKHRHQAHPCLRAYRGLRPRLRLRGAAGLGRPARRRTGPAQAPAGRALPAPGRRHRTQSRHHG